MMLTPIRWPRLSTTSAKCKSRTIVLLVHHPAPWSLWSPWSTLIHLGPQFPECGYTKWTKQDQGGPGVVQGHQQDHGAGQWTRSIQDHPDLLKNIFLMQSWIEAEDLASSLADQQNVQHIQKSISSQTGRQWLPKLGLRQKEISKGIYHDSYKRDDVITYRNIVFLPTLRTLTFRLMIWDEELQPQPTQLVLNKQ